MQHIERYESRAGQRQRDDRENETVEARKNEMQEPPATTLHVCWSRYTSHF